MMSVKARVNQLALAGLMVMLFCTSARASTDGKLMLATDLQADAKASARLCVPILLFFSLKGCPYCETIRASHLLPMQAEAKPRVLIRQVNLQDSVTLRDFNGLTTSHREYSQARKINFAPVVLLVDGSGKELVESLKGAMLPDFYGAHLEEAIAKATARTRNLSATQ